jgi:hypothetical protein
MSALFFPSLLKLDDQILTDQGREPLEIQRDERSVTNQLASGKQVRYIKAVKKRFVTSWTWLPSESDQTIDGGAGRNDLVKFRDSGGPFLLTVEDDVLGFSVYNVFIEQYDEKLIRRDPHSGLFFFDVSMEFIEQ